MAKVLTVVGMALIATATAHAQCTDPKAPALVKKSLLRTFACNDRIFKDGPGTPCPASSLPDCAGPLAIHAAALGYGPNNPPLAAVNAKALRRQLGCQKTIGRAMANFAGRKLTLLQKKRPDPDARAARALFHVKQRCAVTVALDPSGVVVPAVGPQCAAAVGAPGSMVDAAKLRDCLAALLGVWVERQGPDPQPLRPNIVFILTDDQRWDTTDGTHSPDGAFIMPRTRAALADHGVEFGEAFMTTPLCCPSRASILSGSYAHRTGVYRNQDVNGGADDFDDASTIATWLQAAGYRTSLIGKYLNGYNQLWSGEEPPYVPPGWSEWRGLRRVSFFDYRMVEPDGLGGYLLNAYGSAPEDYLTDVLREKAKAFISSSVALEQPFFLYLALKAPHLPQIPAPRHEGTFQHFPPWRPPSWNETDVSDKPSWLAGSTPMTPAAIADLDQIRIDQLEMLRAVDEAIGGSPAYGIVGIMEHLENLGVAGNTMVVFFSDNGWFWGEHRLRAKNNPYEEAIRSPMLVRYPRLTPCPRRETRLALNLDLAPTFAELAGAGVPIQHDGTSLVRVLDGTATSWRTDFLTEGWPSSHPWATVREARWKYTEIPVTPGDPTTAFERELYDLDSDPYELDNLAGDPQHAARLAQMAVRLRELRPNWPVDSDPGSPDPPEPPDDD